MSMTRQTRSLTARRRDAGLRRLRTANRVLISLVVGATALLTDVAANAFPGHRRSATPVAGRRTRPLIFPGAGAPAPGAPAPAAPAASPSSPTTPSGPTAPTAPTAPPAPVVSGGS